MRASSVPAWKATCSTVGSWRSPDRRIERRWSAPSRRSSTMSRATAPPYGGGARARQIGENPPVPGGERTDQDATMRAGRGVGTVDVDRGIDVGAVHDMSASLRRGYA